MLKTKLFHNHSQEFLVISLIFISTVFMLFYTTSLFAANNSYMKCWKNVEGVTECGNRIPREYYSQRVRFIDDRGVTRDIKEKSKTREERIAAKEAAEKEQQLLAQEEEKKRKQKMDEDILLKTFLTVDDLLASMNSKLALTNSRIDILEGSIPGKQRKFDALLKKAANMERAGKKPSDNLFAELDAIRADIKNTKLQIKIEQDKQISIKQTYRKDIERFVLLKGKHMKYKAKTEKQQEKIRIAHIVCRDQQQCMNYWEQAAEFVKKYSFTSVIYKTDIFSVSGTPEEGDQLAITVAVLDDNLEKEADKKTILLHIRCHHSAENKKACSDKKIKHILNDFKNIPTNQVLLKN